jgi:ABC-2 type transport system ATP-binding protein
MPDAIVMRNIFKSYRVPSIIPWRKPRIVNALNGINLSCPEKKVTCLLGPNGAGKTTIMKILAGLVIADSGTVNIINNPQKKYRIGLVTQNERSFYWRISGRQNLDFYAALYNLRGTRKRQKIAEVLSEIGMEDEADKPFRLYSAGMRQKLHIARALLCDPDVLLLDEPTTHIDPVSQENIHGFIRNEILRKRKSTVLLCTHDLHEAQILSDKIVLVDKGGILAEGSINSLRSMINPGCSMIMEFSKMPAKGWDRGLDVRIFRISSSRIEIEMDNQKKISHVIKAAIKNGGEITGYRKKEESLFEIFSRLTGDGTKE